MSLQMTKCASNCWMERMKNGLPTKRGRFTQLLEALPCGFNELVIAQGFQTLSSGSQCAVAH